MIESSSVEVSSMLARYRQKRLEYVRPDQVLSDTEACQERWSFTMLGITYPSFFGNIVWLGYKSPLLSVAL